jgi:Cu(I)/Ag(I) efflux system membrane protein CusA/SilA
MSETTVVFKPKDTWPRGLTKDAIMARLDEKLQIPGVTNIWTQPIRNRIDMLSTGIRTQIGIKVFGPDLSVIEELSNEIKNVVRQIPGATDVYAERNTGSPYLEMTVDRPAANRYGLNVADVEDVIETAVGGKNLTTTIEGRQRFPVRVRYARDFRQNPKQLGEVLVTRSNGAQVALNEVASTRTVMGPSMISSENGLLRGSVLLNVRGRDVGGFVEQARREVAQRVQMPTGYYVQWSGQFENQISARKRLQLVIPLVLLVIFVLLLAPTV